MQCVCNAIAWCWLSKHVFGTLPPDVCSNRCRIAELCPDAESALQCCLHGLLLLHACTDKSAGSICMIVSDIGSLLHVCLHSMSPGLLQCEQEFILVTADFCQQQIGDIVALTGHITEAASTKYSVSTEGKRVFKCHVASKPIIPCCNHLCLHSLMHCSQQDAQYSGVHVFLKDQHTL